MPDFSKMNVIELYRNRVALESSVNQLRDDAGRALVACESARMAKVDALYAVLKNSEAEIEHWKQEAKLVADAKKKAEGTVARIKSLLNHLKNTVPQVSNKLLGRNYSFTLVKQRELSVEISSDIESDWDAFEKLDFAFEEVTTKSVVVQSVCGDEISRKVQTSTRFIPNLDAIRHAYRTDPSRLPEGVRVLQRFSIRTGRVASPNLPHSGSFLPEVECTEEQGGG